MKHCLALVFSDLTTPLSRRAGLSDLWTPRSRNGRPGRLQRLVRPASPRGI